MQIALDEVVVMPLPIESCRGAMIPGVPRVQSHPLAVRYKAVDLTHFRITLFSKIGINVVPHCVRLSIEYVVDAERQSDLM